jgi:hypothetical protein
MKRLVKKIKEIQNEAYEGNVVADKRRTLAEIKNKRKLARNKRNNTPKVSTTDYLLQGDNGNRLLESIQQLKEGKLHERV